MDKTWASGAVELLRHADSHIESEAAFDKRIAFISIDNCVETCIQVFLSLPESMSGIKISRAKLDETTYSFPRKVELLIEKLFGVAPVGDFGDTSALANLIQDWNRIERFLKETFEKAGAGSHTYKWEIAQQQGLLDLKIVPEITELRFARNRLAHSDKIDEEDVKFWARKAKLLLRRLVEPAS